MGSIQYKPLCFNIAFNILGSNTDSEECVNDALFGLWNAIPPQRPSNLKAFICKITRNTALTRLKFNTRQKRKTAFECSIDEISELIPDERLSPYSTDEELACAINNFLDTLSLNHRNIFLRKYWYFDSVKEIAERFSCTESKINNILYRTRQKLLDYLRKEEIYL